MTNLTTGSTHRLKLAATKDGVTWDLTGATVSLVLTDPDGNEATYSATLSGTPTDGTAYYDLSTSILDQVGTWKRTWKVVQSSVTMWSTQTKFQVSRGA